MKKIFFSVSILVLATATMAFTYKSIAHFSYEKNDIKYFPLQTKPFAASSVQNVNTDAINADIKVFGDAKNDATLTVSAYGQNAEKLSAQALQTMIAKYYDIQINHKSNGSLFISEKNKTDKIPQGAQFNFLFELHALPSVSVNTNTISGDAAFKGITNATVSTISGDIAMYDILGKVQASSTSGDIVAARVATIQNIKTISGDIILNVHHLSKDVAVSSVSGDIKLHIAKEVQANVYASTVSGDLDASGIKEIAYSDNAHQSMTGALNGGANNLIISSVSGDVKISKM
ncbi:MAG TPA: DUF4097 family beta strand repeat-containing protein [Arachidicoccus sp.]